MLDSRSEIINSNSEHELNLSGSLIDDSFSSKSSNFSNGSTVSNDTNKVLSKHRRKITAMLRYYGENKIAKQIQELIDGQQCSIKTLTVFGDNFKIIDKNTGEQYLLLKEGLVKGNVKFSKGFFVFSDNSLKGSGEFVDYEKPNNIQQVYFNGEINTDKQKQNNIKHIKPKTIQEHSCEVILRQSDEEIVCCNTRRSKKDNIITSITTLFNSMKDAISDITDIEDANNIAGIAKQVGEGVIKAIPTTVKNFKDKFNPNHAINDQKNHIKQNYLTQPPLYKHGLNLAYTDKNCLLNNNTSFEDFKRTAIFGIGRIRLNNCAYIGYVDGKTKTTPSGNVKLHSIKIMSSKDNQYPCMIAFDNGDMIYGIQQNNKIIKGYYYAQHENKMLPFDATNIKCLCTNIDTVGPLTTDQKNVLINANSKSLEHRFKRSINEDIQAAYKKLYNDITATVFKKNIDYFLDKYRKENNKEAITTIINYSAPITKENDYNSMSVFNHKKIETLADLDKIIKKNQKSTENIKNTNQYEREQKSIISNVEVKSLNTINITKFIKGSYNPLQ